MENPLYLAAEDFVAVAMHLYEARYGPLDRPSHPEDLQNNLSDIIEIAGVAMTALINKQYGRPLV